MNKVELKHYKNHLEEIKDSLISGADKTITEMTDHSDHYPDPTDRASAESDRNFELRIRDRERKLLSKINSALDRITDESYGICDACGDDIGKARLKARPVTTLCITCKTKQEDQEKSKSG